MWLYDKAAQVAATYGNFMRAVVVLVARTVNEEIYYKAKKVGSDEIVRVTADSPPPVMNPVLPTENLAARWTRESFRSFVRELGEAVEWAEKTNSATDVVEAAEAWREILGDDFPSVAPSHFGIQLADFSHAQTAAERGWREALDPRYSVRITATEQRGKRETNRRRYPDNGPPTVCG